MPTRADDLHTFLRTRRSIRRFLGPAAKTGKPDPVPASVIERILTTATYAPSAHNLQPWRFAVVTHSPARARLGQALTSAMRADMTSEGAQRIGHRKSVANSLRRMDEAPVVILLCRDVTAVREYKPEDTVMSIQSVANAATYLLLAAHAEGWGKLDLLAFYAQEETRTALELSETWEPQAMFFVGWADEEPKEKVVKVLEETTRRL